MKTHELKTDPDVFDAVESGLKTFEIRFDDRSFQVGDKLILRRTQHTGDAMKGFGAPLIYTERPSIEVEVLHKLTGPKYGLESGWCILSFNNPKQKLDDINEGKRLAAEIAGQQQRVSTPENCVSVMNHNEGVRAARDAIRESI